MNTTTINNNKISFNPAVKIGNESVNSFEFGTFVNLQTMDQQVVARIALEELFRERGYKAVNMNGIEMPFIYSSSSVHSINCGDTILTIEDVRNNRPISSRYWDKPINALDYIRWKYPTNGNKMIDADKLAISPTDIVNVLPESISVAHTAPDNDPAPWEEQPEVITVTADQPSQDSKELDANQWLTAIMDVIGGMKINEAAKEAANKMTDEQINQVIASILNGIGITDQQTIVFKGIHDIMLKIIKNGGLNESDVEQIRQTIFSILMEYSKSKAEESAAEPVVDSESEEGGKKESESITTEPSDSSCECGDENHHHHYIVNMISDEETSDIIHNGLLSDVDWKEISNVLNRSYDPQKWAIDLLRIKDLPVLLLHVYAVNGIDIRLIVDKAGFITGESTLIWLNNDKPFNPDKHLDHEITHALHGERTVYKYSDLFQIISGKKVSVETIPMLKLQLKNIGVDTGKYKNNAKLIRYLSDRREALAEIVSANGNVEVMDFEKGKSITFKTEDGTKKIHLDKKHPGVLKIIPILNSNTSVTEQTAAQ